MWTSLGGQLASHKNQQFTNVSLGQEVAFWSPSCISWKEEALPAPGWGPFGWDGRHSGRLTRERALAAGLAP